MTASTTAQVFSLERRPLSEANPGYGDIEEIERFFAVGSPVYLAAHWIPGAGRDDGREYSCDHAHDDCVEINLILGEPGELLFDVVLGDGGESQRVASPSAIVIPPGTRHSANVVEGRGWFVVARLERSVPVS